MPPCPGAPGGSAPAAGAERHRQNLIWQRRLSVVTLYVSLAVFGVHVAVRGPSHQPASDLLFSLAWGLLVTWACVLDSRLRGKPLPWTVYWLFFGFWYVAFPIYYLRARGWRGLPWLALWTLTALFAVGVPVFVVTVIAALVSGLPG